ncbi:transmembrane protease serine [Holotrichia oblita]|uniref:Transmembrane protease serine n=1 Tax=Holotrichia oblita TaxID=644536 RepID=A0ACB9SR42_HOLOL|nr:transmembrane protease serine [Holotrichia oblita]
MLPVILVAVALFRENLAFIKSGGHPKFPHQVCGSRSINWNPQRTPKIIGGEQPPLGAVPWVVDLQINGKHHCGGVLISTKLVLTVAHCYIVGLTARVGAVSAEPSEFEQNIKIEKAVLHPKFKKFGPYSNDIAVLLLASAIEENAYVKPACVSNKSPPAGTICEVSGWGAFDPKKRDVISPVLQTAIVPLLSLNVCRENKVYGGRHQSILDTMVCAGKLNGGVDACGGDSGGPLTCHFEGRLVLTGLVSWGDGCAKKHRPGVYTRVASYKEWIHEVAEGLNEEI